MKTYEVKPTERKWYKNVMSLEDDAKAGPFSIVLSYMMGRSIETEQALQEINANVLALSAEVKELKSQLAAQQPVHKGPSTIPRY